jgi:hypothetical protein
MTRTVHLTGSVPGRNARQAMLWSLDLAGEHLVTLPDGETGRRALWIRSQFEGIAALPGVEAVNADAGWTSYADVPQCRLRPGAALTCGAVAACLPAVSAFTASYPVFASLRAQAGLPDLEFQVGMPSHVDLAMCAFGEQGLRAEVYDACLDATAAQVRACADLAADVVFQIEAPIATGAVTLAEPAMQPKIAEEMASRLADLPQLVPAGTRFGVHLCLGDLGHEAHSSPPDAGPLVQLANAIAAAWPMDRPLAWLHMPFAAAARPPSLDPAFYRPLADLEVPPHLRVIAGFVHENFDACQHREVLADVELILGRPVGVAATCGLGRREPQQAAAIMRMSALLAGDG